MKPESLEKGEEVGLLRALPLKLKYLSTFSIFLGNVCLGTAYNAYGPALVDLANKYEVKTDGIAIVFTILTIGYLVGALITSFAYNFISRQFGVIIFMMGIATAMYLTPHMPSLALLCVVSGLLGVSCGGYDASQIVWMMEMWQAEAGPYIQAQHFSYALGTLIPSLLLAPFLTAEEENESGGTTTTWIPERNPDMYIPFTVVGALVSVSVLYQVYLITFNRYFPPPPEEGRIDAKPDPSLSNNNHNDSEDPKVEPVKSRINWRALKLVALTALFLGAYQGMEMCTFAFLSTFAQNGELALSQREGAYVMSGVTGALTVGRGVGVLAVLRFQPQFIVCVNVVLIILANVVLLLWADGSEVGLWAGAILLGFGFSTTYASACAYSERHVMFTNIVGATMLITGSGVASIYPLVVGEYIDENPTVLMYVNFFSLFWMLIAAGFLYKMTYGKRSKLEE